jgi:ketosteroid isomerase-like protein
MDNVGSLHNLLQPPVAERFRPGVDQRHPPRRSNELVEARRVEMKQYLGVVLSSLRVLSFANGIACAQVAFSQNQTKDVVAIEQVFSAYVYLIDSHQWEALADLFTEDGVDDHYQNANGIITPVNNGAGCKMTGRAQMILYWELDFNTDTPLPDPGNSHHIVTSKLIDVEGDTATMKAVWFSGSTSAGKGVFGTTGEYDNIFQRTKDGWKIARDRVIFDTPVTTSFPCDMDGPHAQFP